jgi:hypothetical protein
MSNTVSCPSCSRKLKAPSDAIGKMVKCACGHSFVLPAATWDSAPLQFERPGDGPSFAGKRRGQKQDRYPWLSTYLGWVRAGAVVVLVCGIGSSVFMLIKGMGMTAHGSTFTEGYGLMVGAVIVLLSSIVEFVATFALTEFVKVVMDIELSARSLLEFARQRAA